MWQEVLPLFTFETLKKQQDFRTSTHHRMVSVLRSESLCNDHWSQYIVSAAMILAEFIKCSLQDHKPLSQKHTSQSSQHSLRSYNFVKTREIPMGFCIFHAWLRRETGCVRGYAASGCSTVHPVPDVLPRALLLWYLNGLYMRVSIN